MIKRLKTYLTAEQGFSLTELVMVTMLMSVILAAAYMALQTVNTTSDGMMARSQAQDGGQIAIERMTREIRQAQTVTDSVSGKTYRMAAASATSISFWADVDHNGTLDRVTYTLSSGQVTRVVAVATKQYPGPSDFGANGAATVITKVDPSLTTMFTLLNKDGTATTDISDAPLTAVTAVQVSMRTVGTSGAQSISVDFPPSYAQVRSFGPGIVPWN